MRRLPVAAAIGVAVCAGGGARASETREPASAFVEFATSFVPYANDAPFMLGGGVRIANRHEIWARGGYVLTGDDRRLGFATGGYRYALRPGKLVRPVLGTLVAVIPETCGHDALGNPDCQKKPLFIFAGTAGVRFELSEGFAVAATLTLGTDSYPNPFGMIEGAFVFTL